MSATVVLIGTGGTIASRYDAKLGRKVASQRGEDLLAQVPQLAEVAALEIDDFATVSSFDMPTELAFRLAGRVNQHLGARRGRRRGGDPRHRHHGGELLSDRPAAPVRQARGVHRRAAGPRRSEPGRAEQPARRGAHRRSARGARARRADLLCRPDPCRARRDQGERERARHLPVLRQGRARRGRWRPRGDPPPARASRAPSWSTGWRRGCR